MRLLASIIILALAFPNSLLFGDAKYQPINNKQPLKYEYMV